ncbi:ergothioneine biosynthesis protein EgtB [Pontibacter cellulosilyticus]|uniref:Ergothioneine biosynthesis protein EgtB n=1 Tax=Pontibacter cellulosilyticus TaxID=1720253 RepID=A0A923N260_9BACT|nr:ergothioneine biosynthesis protein EgtB [Pontibacter cellulosilyticus]MBC5991500.1 ergothioneine biosynthesis protein EgtB [Pontibacter cellulosilyticus]
MPVATATATQDILQLYKQTRAQTEKICKPLEPEDTVVQPIVDVSPPKWHMAHTSWFFETFLLKQHLQGYKEFHPKYSYLFNSYYNNVGNRVQRDQRSTLTRPPLRDIYTFREHVDEHMQQLLQSISEEKLQEILPVLQLGLQHEQQHQELLITDIKYILSTNPLLPTYTPQLVKKTTQATKANFLEVPGGTYTIGYRGDDFCFDNELGVHDVQLEDFQIMNRLVTNGEYLEFMQDGAYQDFRHWLDEGLAMVRKDNLEAPLYWLQQDGEWHRFTMHGLQKVDLNEPVTHISFYEADAYANWAGKRLLTEFEWEAASQVYPPASGNFVESDLLEPTAADPGKEGMQQLYGDTWEWTYSAYHPYPGFTKAPGAIGEYNGKFMINQMVLRGGSCATPENHIRTTYRNFFHPDKRWQYNGIRLASK